MKSMRSHSYCLRLSREGQLLDRNVQRFRGGLVFMAHRLLYHSTLGLRVIKRNLQPGEVHLSLSLSLSLTLSDSLSLSLSL